MSHVSYKHVFSIKIGIIYINNTNIVTWQLSSISCWGPPHWPQSVALCLQSREVDTFLCLPYHVVSSWFHRCFFAVFTMPCWTKVKRLNLEKLKYGRQVKNRLHIAKEEIRLSEHVVLPVSSPYSPPPPPPSPDVSTTLAPTTSTPHSDCQLANTDSSQVPNSALLPTQRSPRSCSSPPPGSARDDVAIPGSSRHLHTPIITSTPQLKKTTSSAKKRLAMMCSPNESVVQARKRTKFVEHSCDYKDEMLFIRKYDLLSYLENTVSCDKCHKRTMKFTINNSVHDLNIEKECRECFDTMSKKQLTSSKNDTMKKLVYANMQNGHGYNYFRTMSGVLGARIVSGGHYRKFQKLVTDQSKEKWEEIQFDAVEKIRNYYSSELDRHVDNDGFLDIDVSYDGTWHTRGHTSKIGMGYVIDIYTTLVVDCHSLCKTCCQCNTFERQKKNNQITDQEFKEKKREHEPQCTRNYHGTAKNMESDIAVILWNRSNNMKLRYTTFVSDGDSSAYNKVCALNNGEGPYSEDNPVEKAECINHFSKRLGTQLRNMAKQCFIEKTVKTGATRRYSQVKGKGKLTDDVIDRLTGYFGKAIRDNINTDWMSMRNACVSGLFHATSTDQKHVHTHCPKGKDSWCFYQEDVAKNRPIRSHELMQIKFQLSEKYMSKVLQIYYGLTTEENMRKCMKGKTQNPNESIHQRVWKLASKDKFVSKPMLDFAMYATAGAYNTGYEKAYLDEAIGMLPRDHSTTYLLQSRDREMQKPVRRTKKMRASKEGPQSGYAAGAF